MMPTHAPGLANSCADLSSTLTSSVVPFLPLAFLATTSVAGFSAAIRRPRTGWERSSSRSRSMRSSGMSARRCRKRNKMERGRRSIPISITLDCLHCLVEGAGTMGFIEQDKRVVAN